LLIVLLIAVALVPRLASATTEPIGCDAALTRSTTDPLQADHFTFNIAEGELVEITVLNGTPAGSNFNAQWRLLTATGAPAASCGGFNDAVHGFDLQRDCGPLPASGNPYQIEVQDQGLNDTGTYVAFLQRLTAAAACETTPITCDAPVSAPLSPAVDSDLLRFNVAEGELVQITVLNGTPAGSNFNAQWRLLTATGAPAASCGGFNDAVHGFDLQRDCGPLPASRNPYQIEVQDQGLNDTGTYVAFLQRLTAAAACETTPITCDAPVSAPLSPAVDSDLLRFNVAEGELVQITVLNGTPAGSNFNAQWRLLTATGAPAASCGGFNDAVHGFDLQRDCGPLPASRNPYQIEVQDQGLNDTGTYVAFLQRLTAAAACETTPITCDAPVSAPLSPAVDSDLLRFNVAEGELVQITVLNGTPAGSNFNAQWRLLTATGAPAASCGGFNDAVHGFDLQRDCGPLPASRNPYQIEVQDQGLNDTGTYVAFLQRLTAAAACETTPITCDAPVSAPLSPAVDSDLLRFNVAEGELVQITVLNGTPAGSNFNAQWRLLTATGAPAASCGGFNDAVHGFDLQRDCGPLPASGNPYQIEVQDQGLNDTGTYRAAINGVSQCVPITTTTTTSTTSTPSTTLTTTTTTTTTTTISTTTTTAPPTTTSTTSSTSTSTTTSTTTTTAPPTTTSTTSTTTTQPPTTTTIRGNLPPDCSAAAASPAMLWPPNHQF